MDVVDGRQTESQDGWKREINDVQIAPTWDLQSRLHDVFSAQGHDVWSGRFWSPCTLVLKLDILGDCMRWQAFFTGR